MIKRFGKLRQWAGEKFGSSHSTIPSEEFSDMRAETKKRHADYERISHALDMLVQSHTRSRVTTERNQTRSHLGVFGEALVKHADMFPRDTPQWDIMTSLGLAECKMDEQMEQFVHHVSEHYLGFLQHSAQRYKEYQAHYRKLESRRLDYDAKLNRLQRASKEMPGLELEVQAAKAKYDDSEYDVVRAMLALQEDEDRQFVALRSFMVSQIAYHRAALAVLEDVERKWDEPVEASDEASPSRADVKVPPLAKIATKKDELDLDALPRRRALYNHEPDHDDELAIHVGDIVYVLDSIDDGWWLGMTRRGDESKYGIFPLVFTEAYPPTVERPPMPSTVSSSSTLALEQSTPAVLEKAS